MRPGEIDASQKLLAESMAEKKPITQMLEHVPGQLRIDIKRIFRARCAVIQFVL